jgi:hypothetical protein
MSSEVTGPPGETAVTARPEIDESAPEGGAPGPGQAESGNRHPADPWFEPGPKLPADVGETGAGESAAAELAGHAASDGAQAEWFLPAGRAGLQPDSLISWDDGDQAPGHTAAPPAATGAPPWAGEEAAPIAGTPPPWESGPWPGPGRGRPRRAPAQVATTRVSSQGAAESNAGQAASEADWRTKIVLAAEIVLVIPGLAMGAVGLRRARADGNSQRRSWLTIALSAAWALVIIILVSTSGGAAGGCAGYPAALRQDYATVKAGLASGNLGTAQAAALGQAASLANTAAASAQQLQVRDALFALAGDLEQAHADVSAHRAVSATLHQHLTADGAALARSCPA